MPSGIESGAILGEQARGLTARADVFALLPDPASVQLCLDVAEDAANAVQGTMAAAHVGADPEGMIASAEEIDLQMLRDVEEGSPLQRFERVTRAVEIWKQRKPSRETLFLDDCRGDLPRCVRSECHDAALVVAPRLLIGAFKHGYLLELLLGRVTYHLLSHCTVPLIMKH
ncbi:hypothetical protein PYH37_002039 [Sinorhizobium numidicum]|uniref:Universal stress protein n=1 Tax=Sinorhizobium numidicum TaxID=680248 RepID=A0ABY8CPK1_9HYPH|nr:hypothetical protein [Sinorhizobium numidicum]WEX74595.1 hypothetical protein PYH37_002039 [Sinorhizobium numidicum]WEX80585.1 hypothetical protein PYH38_002041 [Sinorhizobium numidicum]